MTHLLLTGATGMVGREVLVRAAADPRFTRVSCLIRPGADVSADERLEALCQRIGLRPGTKVRAVAGDVTEPGLGVDGRKISGVTNVIHCAATVSFNHPLDEARHINVSGTKHVLDVCRKLSKLERLDAVSTCYVAGKREGLILESDLEHDAGFHNTYEQTKYESEQLLRAAMAEIPIAVHRPSIVVGDSKTGATGAWKVLYWPLKVSANGWMPVIPYDANGRLDIVPVDFVADGIMALSRDAGALGGTFHLAAGPSRDVTMSELFTRVFGMLHRRPPLRVPPVLFRKVFRPALMLAPSERLKRTLRSAIVYRPYMELKLQFDTTKVDAHLGAAGVICPTVTDYFDTIVQAALDSDFGRRPVAARAS
ncbi:MAG: SDR family oxidoreductase [Candidatus Nanopelagicales bacterium]|nr:SDR family oxidoreductase [Candidatus Nanopelagicales bacterium]